MRRFTVTFRLSGPLSEAVAVEWTDQPAPLDSGQGWEPCLGLPDGAWRFSSHDLSVANPPHSRGPGVFGNLAIRCRLSAAGPWTAVSEDRKEIVILDAEDNPAPPAEAPLAVSAPSLAGTGRIGAEVAVASGLWSGVPAPRLSFQWRRDGTPIPGAVGRTYVPGPVDDRTALDCRVAARNALGEASALTPALRVSYPAPAVIGELPEEIFDQAPGAELVETESAFAGANLAFSAAGAEIDPRTGVLTVSTEAAVSGRTVTVTATNSGGSASVRLRVTVEASAPEPLTAADVQILRSVWRPLGQSVSFTPVVAFPGLAGEAVEAIQWTAATALDVEANWHPCAARPGEAGAFDLLATGHPLPAGAVDPALFTAADAARLSSLRFRWRAAAGDPWSAPSEPLTVPVPTTGSLTPVTLRSRIDFGDGAVVTFSKAMVCGQYNNGDWFVLNPAGGGGFSITSFTPASGTRSNGTVQHGMMRGPTFASESQGFDGTEYGIVRLRMPYVNSLNVDPGRTGNPITLAAAVEASFVKVVSLATPNTTQDGMTIYDRQIILTVVNDVPPAKSFRPSPHGSLTSKTSIATEDDIVMTGTGDVTIDLTGMPSNLNITNTLQRFKGPWPTWIFSNESVRQNWALQSSLPNSTVFAPFYGPQLANAIIAAIAHIKRDATTAANRLELVKRICQIGLDYGQPSKAVADAVGVFWPEVFAATLMLTMRFLPRVTQIQGKLGDMVTDDPWEVNTAIDNRMGGRQWRFVSQAEVDVLPAQGMRAQDWHSGADTDWPMLQPFLPEHIGEPWGKFSGGRSGISASIDAEYRANHSRSTLATFLAAGMAGGTTFLNSPALVGYCDRLRRIRTAINSGAMRDFRDGANSWLPWHVNVFTALRGLYSTPEYVGKPEQPDPPTLTRSGSNLTIAMTNYQPTGGSSITARQYRIRARSASSQAQVFADWVGGWTNFPAGAPGSVTLTGLPAGWHQVQVRTRSALGDSPPSTNVAATSLAPTAYRGMVNMG